MTNLVLRMFTALIASVHGLEKMISQHLLKFSLMEVKAFGHEKCYCAVNCKCFLNSQQHFSYKNIFF